MCRTAEVLITECTFYETDHKQKAKVGRHLHVDHFVEAVDRLKNRDIVLIHVSRRTGVRRRAGVLRRRLGEERMKNIHFLMDFEGSADGGDIDSITPPLADSAE